MNTGKIMGSRIEEAGSKCPQVLTKEKLVDTYKKTRSVSGLSIMRLFSHLTTQRENEWKKTTEKRPQRTLAITHSVIHSPCMSLARSDSVTHSTGRRQGIFRVSWKHRNPLNWRAPAALCTYSMYVVVHPSNSYCSCYSNKQYHTNAHPHAQHSMV